MYYFLNLFFVCCIGGYLMEQGVMWLFKQPYNSGIFHGPWTIIYGIASLIILKIGSIIANLKLTKFLKYLIFFISNFLVLLIVELVAGILIEQIFGIVYWDYSDLPLHIGKYICPLVTLVWCVYASILNYFIYPWLKKISNKIPKFITITVTILFCVDVIYTIWEYLTFI